MVSDPKRGKLVVQLEPHSSGDFYDVKTATPTRLNQYKNRKPLWSRTGPSAHPAEAGPLVPEVKAAESSVGAGKGEGKPPSLAERLKAQRDTAASAVDKREAPELRTYQAEIRRHAGDPQHTVATVQAENRRHAETLLAEQNPGKHISSPDRVEKPESKPADEVSAKTLPERFYSEISAGRMPKDNIALRKLVSEFDGKPATDARMKEAQEAQEALEEALVRRAREIAAATGDTKATFDKLLALYESQPNLNVRTSTSIETQAYSTPAPLAIWPDIWPGSAAGQPSTNQLLETECSSWKRIRRKSMRMS